MTQTATREVRPDGKVRLPPGQHLTTGWPVLHYGSIPRIDLANWRLNIYGLVEEEKSFDWQELNAFGKDTALNDIHCVTTWSKYDNTWEGVPFKKVLEQVKLKPEAKYAMLHSYGGYTTNVPLEDLLRDDVMFATHHGGQELSKDHGWPVRLVVPHLYFWKSAKWINAIQFIDRDRPGFWETYGYHIYGDPWKEERYS